MQLTGQTPSRNITVSDELHEEAVKVSRLPVMAEIEQIPGRK